MQVEDIAMEGLRRCVEALDDLETVAALKSFSIAAGKSAEPIAIRAATVTLLTVA